MSNIDITIFMEWFFGVIIGIFNKIFETMERIKFANGHISILSVVVTIAILSVLIPTILAVTQKGVQSYDKATYVKPKKEKRKKEK